MIHRLNTNPIDPSIRPSGILPSADIALVHYSLLTLRRAVCLYIAFPCRQSELRAILSDALLVLPLTAHGGCRRFAAQGCISMPLHMLFGELFIHTFLIIFIRPVRGPTGTN